MINDPSFIKITHTPTGITVKARMGYREKAAPIEAKLKKLLRSKLWALKNNIENKDVVASYTLPNDDPNPDDLLKYRRNI